MTALMVAAYVDDLAMAKLLLGFGADIDAEDEDEKTALGFAIDHRAAADGGETEVERLLRLHSGEADVVDTEPRQADVFADMRMGQPMRYYNVLTKFFGGTAHFAVNGALLSALSGGGVNLEALPSLPLAVFTTALASAVVIPPYYYLTVRLRRILDRHVHAIAIPMPVAVADASLEHEILVGNTNDDDATDQFIFLIRAPACEGIC